MCSKPKLQVSSSSESYAAPLPTVANLAYSGFGVLKISCNVFGTFEETCVCLLKSYFKVPLYHVPETISQSEGNLA